MNKRKKFMTFFLVQLVLTLVLEIVLRLATIGNSNHGLIENGMLITFVMSVFFAAVVSLISALFSLRCGKNIVKTVMITLTIIFCAQIVYYDIFKIFYTTYSMFNGGQVAEFIGIILKTIVDMWLPLLINFIACGGGIFLIGRVKEEQPSALKGLDKKTAIFAVIIITLSIGSYTAFINLGSKSPGSPYDYAHNTNEIKGSVRDFGYLTASALDAKRVLIRQTKKAFGLLQNKEDAELVDKYFNSRETTSKNEKTGLFKGKNLIFITAESFSSYAINEEYTPTLYKMQEQGFKFENYYNPVWGVSTSDGEYINLLSLLPEAGVWSMVESSENYLPYSLGNQFSKIGYVSKAYHDHNIKFYHRQKSHPNLGYDFDGQGGSFDFTHTWPESDLEMIDKTTQEFLEPDEEGKISPFHVYYLTVSGHMEYNFWNQKMAAKNRDAVKNMGLNEECQAYMAANIEFDKSMELLIKRLEDAGTLDDTVIVIAGDHYPYALKDESINLLRGSAVTEEHQKYESSLIIWTPDMKSEKISKVCSNMDILPTVSNLFGLDYDSRKLMGRDIFSDSQGLVVFEDRSWLSDRGKRWELIERTDSDTRGYVEKTDSEVRDMFKYSAMVLDSDYYRYSDF